MVFPGIYEPTADQQQMMTAENLDAESAAELERAFDEAGAASLGTELLHLQVEGRRNQQVTIVDIRPNIIRRSTTMDGTFESQGRTAKRGPP